MTEEPKTLADVDESGFVFLSAPPEVNPYYVRKWANQVWIFYWNPNKCWVSMAEIDKQQEYKLPLMWARRLSPERADMYHNYSQRKAPEKETTND